MVELVQEYWEELVGRNVNMEAITVKRMRDEILPRALWMALSAARKRRTIGQTPSLETCIQVFATPSPAGHNTRAHTGDDSPDDRRTGDLCQAMPAPNGDISDSTLTVKPIPSFAEDSSARPQKRPLCHSSVALTTRLSAESIEEGLTTNTARGGGFEPSVSLFVWDVGFAGSRGKLGQLLTALRTRSRLSDVCVLLVEGMETPGSYAKPLCTQISPMESQRVTEVVQDALQVRAAC